MRKSIHKVSSSNDSSKGSSISTSKLDGYDSEQSEEHFFPDKEDEDKINEIFDMFAEGYESDQVGLEIMCRAFDKVLSELPKFKLSNHYRIKFIGRLVVRCLKHTPKNNKPGMVTKIEAIRDLCCKLVILAKEKDDHSINREPSYKSHKISAFEKVADIMNGYGLHEITAYKVENWYNEYEEKYSTH